MANLRNVDVIHEGPVKTQPGAGTDIDYIKSSELPLTITIVLDDITTDNLGRKWARANGHWENTGMQGWIELAHTNFTQTVPPVVPPASGDQSTFVIDWVKKTVTLQPK